MKKLAYSVMLLGLLQVPGSKAVVDQDLDKMVDEIIKQGDLNPEQAKEQATQIKEMVGNMVDDSKVAIKKAIMEHVAKVSLDLAGKYNERRRSTNPDVSESLDHQIEVLEKEHRTMMDDYQLAREGKSDASSFTHPVTQKAVEDAEELAMGEQLMKAVSGTIVASGVGLGAVLSGRPEAGAKDWRYRAGGTAAGAAVGAGLGYAANRFATPEMKRRLARNKRAVKALAGTTAAATLGAVAYYGPGEAGRQKVAATPAYQKAAEVGERLKALPGEAAEGAKKAYRKKFPGTKSGDVTGDV